MITTMRRRAVLFLVAVSIATNFTSAAQRRETAEAVRKSIEHAVKATSQDQQQAAFDELVALGCRAVPEIVAVLDDQRRLPVAYIRLNNDGPNSFEAFGQYGPETVTDALAAILNHLTWRDFGFIYNGATPAQRKQTIAGWRTFVRDTPVKNLCAAKRSGH